MSEHTKETWRVGRLSHPRDYKTVQETVGPHDVVVDTETGPYVLASCNMNFTNDAKANARRIVACVNACAGIETHELELMIGDLSIHNQITNKLPEKLTPKATEYRRQRDELLSALEGLHTVCSLVLGGKDGKQHAYFETRNGHFVEATSAMIATEEAITKAKGGVL